MGRNAEITLAWADGEYTFRLAIGQLEELEDKCDAGGLVILDRLTAKTCRVRDYRETIRLGLIGGGKQPVEALKMVKQYVDERPFAESIPIAQAILLAAFVGVKDDPPGKADAAKEPGSETNSQTESTPLPPSTEQEQSSATPPSK